MNIVAHNREAWNRQSQEGCRWSKPVNKRTIQSARAGKWSAHLTPNTPTPREWLGDLAGKRALCLASGGGQQAPVLAAAGARVTSFDLSDEQLAKDRLVAEREGLELETVRGDMADLSAFADESFDLIFHPVSNVFAEDVAPVWRECYRVLKWGGRLLSGFMNPMFFLFDHDEAQETGVLQAKYGLPYSDRACLPPEKLEWLIHQGLPLEFGHTLEEQIGGQTAAGFLIAGVYEDDWDDESTPLNAFASTFVATLARKLRLDESL